MSNDRTRIGRARLEAIHARVLAGDATATVEVCELTLPELRRRLRLFRRREDAHAIETASADAVLVYLREPTRYDPRRAGLMTWLEVIARRRLADLQRLRHRLREHESAAGLELINLQRVAAPAGGHEVLEGWTAAHRAALLAVVHTDAERAFVKARLLAAPRDVQAVALGVAHLPAAQARAEMNRAWEILGRRARRRWHRAGARADSDQP